MRVVSDQQWQAPGASQPPPPVVQPTPAHAPYAGQNAQAAPLAQGWTPPPKPGLVPLRPMTLGTILGASFQVMRRNPRTTLVPGLLLAVLLALTVSIGFLVVIGAVSRIGTTTNSQDVDALAAGSIALALLVALAGGALSTVATALMQAIIVQEVARGTVGERLTLAQIWAAGRGRFGAVVGYTALLIGAVTLGFVLFYALIFGLTIATTVGAASGGSNTTRSPRRSPRLGLTLLGGLGAVVLWLWLSTKLAFVPAAIVLERLPIRRAIVRSWTAQPRLLLAHPRHPAAGAGHDLGRHADRRDPAVGRRVARGRSAQPDRRRDGRQLRLRADRRRYAVIAGLSAIGMVILSATSSLLYLDLRMRKEGLDLELSRFVEARQAGQPVDDPYLPRTTP